MSHMLAFHILWKLAAGNRVVPQAGLHHPIPHQHCWFHRWFICRHSIYYGDAQLATEWFHKLGYTIPYLINAADFILDLASGDVSTKKISGADSRLHLINCAERFLTVSAAASNCSGSCTLAHHFKLFLSVVAVSCCCSLKTMLSVAAQHTCCEFMYDGISVALVYRGLFRSVATGP